jgi:predicted transcriptional regulator
MAGALRTQIYLTADQRRRLDAIARADDKPLAGVIRDAVDEYLEHAGPEAQAALANTFGAAAEFAVPPRDEWEGRDSGARSG